MRFCFDEEKTAQAAAYLLWKFGRRHNVMALMKLLYLADRKALIERGHPITGDHMVSMPHGPVLSETLELINCGRPPGVASPWVAAIHRYPSARSPFWRKRDSARMKSN